MWATDLNGIRGASRKHLKKDTVLSLRSVHGNFMTVLPAGHMACNSRNAGTNEIFTLIRLGSGCCQLRNAAGRYVSCADGRLMCTAETQKDACQFNVKTLEDERIILTTSGQNGGSIYVDAQGNVSISDGNPADEPYFPFIVIKQDDASKKCYSRLLIPRRKPSKLVEEHIRKSSKQQMLRQGSPGIDEPVSPGKQAGIEAIDMALEMNAALRSAR